MELTYALQNVAEKLQKGGLIFMPFHLIYMTLTTYNSMIIILVNNC